MPSLPAKFRYMNFRVSATGEVHCEFCGKPLPTKHFVVKALVRPLRLLVTYVLLVFMPWRVGAYLASHKKGALAGPIEVLLPSAGLFYGAQFAALGDIGSIPLLGFDRDNWLGKLVFWVICYSFLFFLFLLFHGFVKAFGSNEGFKSSLIGIIYAISAWFLAMAALLTLHIGLQYRMLFSFLPSPLRWWERIVEPIILIWTWLGGLVLIQSKIHRIPWYRVAASAILAGIAYYGWVLYLIEHEYGP